MQDFKPLTDAELKTVETAARLIRDSIQVPCTGCAYCVDGCPMSIQIPDIFKLYNEDKSRDARADTAKYNDICEKFSPASACVECGQCEGICPQKLPIIESLKKAAQHFENQ